jgi:hypothetical protein
MSSCQEGGNNGQKHLFKTRVEVNEPKSLDYFNNAVLFLLDLLRLYPLHVIIPLDNTLVVDPGDNMEFIITKLAVIQCTILHHQCSCCNSQQN